MGNLLQDLRYGLRMLRRNSGVALALVLTLALGVGGTTAVFTFANALFLRPLDLPEPDRLVRMYSVDDERGSFGVFSYPDYADLRDGARVFSGLAAHQYAPVSLGTGDVAEPARAEVVSGNYFHVLRADTVRGRALLPSDDGAPGQSPVCVISHALWNARLGGDPEVVGSVLHVNGHPLTVVGVARAGFRGSYEAGGTDLWAPMSMHEQVRPRGVGLDRRGWGWLHATGRLADGVTLDEAAAEVERLAALMVAEYPNESADGFEIFRASALPESDSEKASQFVGLFAGVVVLVLLVTCGNLASVLLSQVLRRRREIAIRQSIGAGRWRIAFQWCTESLLLSLLGGAAGLVLAVWIRDAMTRLIPEDLFPYSLAPTLDTRVFLFAFGVAVAAGLLFGALPAMRASRVELVTALRGEVAPTGRLSGARLRSLFVVSQVTVSLVLLVVTGLMLSSLQRARTFDPGFDSEGVLLAEINLTRNGYDRERGAQLFRDLESRLAELPGVRSVTRGLVVPLGFSGERRGVTIAGHEPPAGRSTIPVSYNIVGKDYFRTMGIPVRQGREFAATDRGGPPAVIVNETLATRYWPAEDPLGRQIGGFGPDGQIAAQIVGVVADIKYKSLGEEPRPFVYAFVEQDYFPMTTYHLRTDDDPMALLTGVRHELRKLDPAVALESVSTLDELRAIPMLPSRAVAMLAGWFGLIALALTSIGLYGLVSASVGQRTREIGIRIALGARPGEMFRRVVLYGTSLAGVGVVLGWLASLGVTRFLEGLLFRVTATDPATFASVAVLLVTVALLASYLPARRAARVDPVVSLRQE